MANNSNITQEYLKSIFDYDPESGIFKWKERADAPKRWNTRYAGKIAGSKHNRGYRSVSLNKKDYLLHRLAFIYYFGKYPENEIDHINGDRSDNRICNLREANRFEQCFNTCIRKDNVTGIKGVTWSKNSNKWCVQIWANKKAINIGYFENFDDAKIARKMAEEKYHGEFARAAQVRNAEMLSASNKR